MIRILKKMKSYQHPYYCIKKNTAISHSNKANILKISKNTHFRNNKKPEWVVHKIIYLKAMMPKAGCRKVSDTFNRVFMNKNIMVSKSYVANVIKNHQYQILKMHQKIKSHQASVGQLNQAWGIDLTFKQDAHQNMLPILGIIDHGSRHLITLKTITHKMSWCLIGHICLAIAKNGKPKGIKTDNERCFNSFIFNSFLKCVGIKHHLSDKHAPWQNGKIERLFGTLKVHLNQLAILNSETLQKLLIEFTFWYNKVRPHQHLQGRTPHEVWHEVDPFKNPINEAHYFSAWNGLLTGFYIKR